MENDHILVRALARLTAAKAEVARLEAFFEVYREFGGTVVATTPDVRPQLSPDRRKAATVVSGALSDSANAAVAYIRQTGRAVPTRDLIKVLTDQGIAVGGKDEIATLSARLSRSDLLRNIRGQGWDLAEPEDRIPMRDGTVGDLLASVPTAPVPTPNSADEDGREVEHEKTDIAG